MSIISTTAQWISQFLVVVWKNMKLRMKSWKMLVLELLTPIVVVMFWVSFMAIMLDNNNTMGTRILKNLNTYTHKNALILYAPVSLEVQGVMDDLANNSHISRSFLLGFRSFDALHAYYRANSTSVLAGLYFGYDANMTQNSTNTVVNQSITSYSISMDNWLLESTSSAEGDGRNAAKEYIDTGFTSLQLAVDSALMRVLGGVQQVNSSITVNEFPGHGTPMWKQWLRTSGLGQVGAIFFLIGFFVSSFRMMTDRVYEKEMKIRELLRMGGLRTGTESAGWWVTVLLVTSGSIISLAYILKAMEILRWSSIHYVLVFYFATIVSLIALAQLISVFVNKAKFAGMLGFVIVLILGGVGVAVNFLSDSVSTDLKFFLCIFAPTGFAIGNGILFELEDNGIGLTRQQYTHGDISVRDIVVILCVDALVYTILAWYMDLVLPGEYGTTRSPIFFLKPSYWMSAEKSSAYEPLLLDPVDSTAYTSVNDIENVGKNMKGKEAVVVKDVRKEFVSNNSHKVAVDGLSMVLYEDHITALLGHNGAGKTTTISMLTGLIAPTSGKAYIYGKSIGDQMNEIRSSLTLGVCPQANVLWDDFSVVDHLYIHAVLKGVSLLRLRSTVNQMIKDLGLEEKRHTPSAALSGGQKRKLQLAIAFIGSSKVIFLDEPTSGMDPVTRRSVWDFLKKYKAGKTIVLTTHFMDEADILGDRIVVVSQGRLRCAGSSLFLKSRFGVGYLLTMVKSPNCKTASIDDLVKEHIPNPALLSDFGAELAYRLPGNDLAKISQLLAEIDRSRTQLGIDSYGISLTTLEEVFLRIGMEETDSANQKTIDLLHSNSPSAQRALAIKSPNGHSFFQQVYALLKKRVLCAPRDIRAMMFTFVLPLLFVAGAIVVAKTLPGSIGFSQNVSPLQMGLWQGARLAVQDGNDLLSWAPYFINDPSALVDIPNNTTVYNFLSKNSGLASGVELSNETLQSFNDSLNLNYDVWFNKTYNHVVPATLNLVNDAAMRNLTNGTLGITTTIAPFEHILSQGESALLQSNPNLVIFLVMIMMAAFALIPGGLVTTIVQEKALNIKRLMLVSGTSKLAYWLSNLIWDLFMFEILIVLILALFACVKLEWILGVNWSVGLIMFNLYALSALTMSYVVALGISSYTTTMPRIFALHFVLSFFFLSGYISVAINASLDDSEGLNTASTIVKLVFIGISPNFNAGYVLFTLQGFLTSSPPRTFAAWFALDSLGWSAVCFACHAVFWWILLLLIEYRSSLKITYLYRRNIYQEKEAVEEDADVAKERLRISNGREDVVVVRGMRKEYPDGKKGKKIAVANLSLGIPSGQCFGLLGMNGAGKSTTLGVLSADIGPTCGEIYLNGYNLLTDPRDALRYFGWCPQFDALIETLTGREQLAFYARIKGLNEEDIPTTVAAFLEVLDMEHLADRLTGGYSGGNKRKLSLAIAMIGNPPLVFLDEPSTGMDPLSKRLMWRVIAQLGQDKAVVVTTHYMEECEALCSRIGIMSEGRLVCLGSSQHLKSRFATGYTIQIKSKAGKITQVRQTITQKYPHAQLTDSRDDLLVFQLPNIASHNSNDTSHSIANVFTVLVEMKDLADDFSVSQTTLEQVFLKLAKEKDSS